MVIRKKEKTLAAVYILVLSLHCIAEECVLCPFKKEFFAFVDALVDLFSVALLHY